MAGLNISDLPMPPDRFRVDQVTRRNDGIVTFETYWDCLREESRRAKGFARAIEKGLLVAHEASARDLLSRLDLAAQTGEASDTLASSLFMRGLRIRVCGWLWKLMAMKSRHTTVTIIPKSWEFTPEQLMQKDPRKLLAGFRTALYKEGVASVPGWLFACVHGEFDPCAKVYRLHLHIACTKTMVPIIDRLRQRRGYQSRRFLGNGDPSPVYRRVWVRRKPLDNMPDPVTYVVQSFWPARPIYFDDKGGRHRLRQKGAIREPFHSLVLLWLDRWEPKDLTLMVGLRATSSGLRRTRK